MEQAMKAVVLAGIHSFELQEIFKPQIQRPTDVLIKMAAVGVCGSDIHYYKTGRIGDQVVQYPFIIGHECSGIVKEIGDKVTRVTVGDRIFIEPSVSCNVCSQCLANRHHTCLNVKFLGAPGQLSGAFAEYLVMPQENCFVVPDELSLTDAALIEPLSIGIYSVRLAGNLTGKKIAILGAGPIGLSVFYAAKLKNIAKAYITDKIAARLYCASGLGADWIGNPDQSDIVQDIHYHEPESLDVVFECCGEQEALDQAIDLLKPGGSLLVVGIPEVDRISFNISQVRRKEITIYNVRRQNHCVEESIEVLQKATQFRDSLFTHRFSFEETDKAFKTVSGHENGVIKAIVAIN
jgi:L-iditol 2-dehydrogenase